MHFLEEAKKWLGEITEIFLLLVALGIVMEILFGPDVWVFAGITRNLTALIAELGENGLVGLIALGVIVWLFQRRKLFANPHS